MVDVLKKLVRDPLGHFLALGLLLFVVLSLFSDENNDQRTIVVDRQTLLSFIQYRTKVFKPEVAAKRLDSMPEDVREQLVQDYIEEEALYRESKALGLDGDDYVIRRRMVQKLEFISQGFAEQSLEIEPDSLRTFFKENLVDYRIRPSITFTHVYLPHRDDLNSDQEKEKALQLLDTLNSNNVNFSDSVKYGSRFPYHLNYVEKTQEFVASHFGDAFADEVFDSSVTRDKGWFGPVQSRYGLHLVKINRLNVARDPELEEVETMVRQDYRMHLLRKEQQKTVDTIVQQYNIVRY